MTIHPTYYVKHPDGTYSVAHPQPMALQARGLGAWIAEAAWLVSDREDGITPRSIPAKDTDSLTVFTVRQAQEECEDGEAVVLSLTDWAHIERVLRGIAGLKDQAFESTAAVEPTDAEIDSACMWFRHDFGLLEPEEKERVRYFGMEWLRAWRKVRHDEAAQ